MVILSYMAKEPNKCYQASDISHKTNIALPTTAKLLKKIAKSKILSSSRGSNGGYTLSKTPASISLVEIISAIEGPIAITECNINDNKCNTSHDCPIKPSWQFINYEINKTLSKISLLQLALNVNLGIEKKLNYIKMTTKVGETHGTI